MLNYVPVTTKKAQQLLCDKSGSHGLNCIVKIPEQDKFISGTIMNSDCGQMFLNPGYKLVEITDRHVIYIQEMYVESGK